MSVNSLPPQLVDEIQKMRQQDPLARIEDLQKWAVSANKVGWFPTLDMKDFTPRIKKTDLFSLFLELARERERVHDEAIRSEATESRVAAITRKHVEKDDFLARIAALENSLAEQENINRTQHSRLVEERRAAATANRINDQLQMRLDELQNRLDRQIDIINERARANDAALAALSAKAQGRLLTYEMRHGIVTDVSESDVVIRFDTGDDVVEQNYDLDQFKLGKLPAIRDQISFYIHLALVPQSSTETADENKGHTHEPRPRRNVVTGDRRF